MADRPPTRYAPGIARRTKVLEAAIEVMAERGLEGATHRAIATRAGVPLGTTSYFFDSIDDLIGAAISHIADRLVASVQALVAESSGGVLQREEFADRLIALLSSSQPREVIVQFEAYLATERRPELREPVSLIRRAFEDAAATALEAVGVRSSAAVAEQFVAVIDGFALHRVTWPRAAADSDALAGALRRLLDSHLEHPD